MKDPALINLSKVPEVKNFWGENERYKRYRKHISKALGSGEKGAAPHPFDVELTRIVPGHHNCPQHSHAGMAEFFVILSGEGIMYRNDEEYPIREGDCFYQEAGTAHRMLNTSKAEDLVFLVIANEVSAELQKSVIHRL